MKNWQKFLFALALLLACVVRLYRFDAPIADWHSWRQSDTAAVARNFDTLGFDLLRPRYDDLSNIQSGKDNPEGWRMVEMPLYQAFGYGLNLLVPSLTIEESLRVVSIVSTAVSILLLGILLLEFESVTVALIGVYVYALLPYSIFYGRAILPDAFGTMWALLSITVLAKTKRWIWVIVAGIAAAISLLVRPMEVFMLLPSLYLIFRTRTLKNGIFYVLLYWVIASIPLYLWRQWILQFPEGIAVSSWLLNKDNIRFKGAWFYWLFARRIPELILGYWGLIPFALGCIVKPKKDVYFSLAWIFGAILYLVIFAGGNVQHDYYQALIIPVIVYFVSIGLGRLISPQAGLQKIPSYLLAFVSVAGMIAFSWYTMRTYFWINHPEIVEAGKAADKLLPKNAKVIASYNGDTTFLYQIRRQGWPLGFDIEQKIGMGAEYYVTISPTDADGETKDLAERYTVLVRNDTYAIIDLTRPVKTIK